MRARVSEAFEVVAFLFVVFGVIFALSLNGVH